MATLPHGKYVPRNHFDRVLLLFLAFCALFFALRCIDAYAAYTHPKSVRVSLSFAVLGIEADVADALSDGTAVFRFADTGREIGAAAYCSYAPVSPQSHLYNLHLCTNVTGAFAKDGRFLLDGRQTVLAGESYLWEAGGTLYTVRITDVTVF